MEHLSLAPYRQILSKTLQRRQLSNRSYSLRAFARDLKISPASLSLVLSGRQGLSPKSAAAISESLGLSLKEKDLFIASVLELHSRSEKVKIAAKRKVELAKIQFKKENENVLNYWWNIPILEFLRSHPETTPGRLAQAFDLPVTQIQFHIEYLKHVGVLKKSKNLWQVSENYLGFGDAAPSAVVKSFHLETLKQASSAIEMQSMKERLLSSTFFNIDPKKKEKAFEALKRFRQEFCVDYSEEGPGNLQEVYCLAIQFFKAQSR